MGLRVSGCTVYVPNHFIVRILLFYEPLNSFRPPEFPVMWLLRFPDYRRPIEINIRSRRNYWHNLIRFFFASRRNHVNVRFYSGRFARKWGESAGNWIAIARRWFGFICSWIWSYSFRVRPFVRRAKSMSSNARRRNASTWTGSATGFPIATINAMSLPIARVSPWIYISIVNSNAITGCAK